MSSSTLTSHSWKFFRAGGFDQVDLTNGADLLALDQLDQKLWVALACPTTGLEFDKRTLDLIDTDKDGRIRAPELMAAVKWAASLLKNPDDLVKGPISLPLAAINDTTPQGKAILNSAKTILANLGKADATEITIADTTDTSKIFAQTTFNGDGIIPMEAAADEATKAAITEIIASIGSEMDRSGKPGVSQAKVDAFYTELTAFDAWMKKSEIDAATVLPLGENTAASHAAFRAVKAKIDDFFARCRLAAFDHRAIAALNREEKDFLSLAAKDLTITSNEIAIFPLSAIAANKSLPLTKNVNPAWADALSLFQTQVVKPLLGDKTELTEQEWALIWQKFCPYENWQKSKAGVAVEKLGIKRVRDLLGGKVKETLTALIARDKAEESNANTIADVDKLVRFHAHLHHLCENFVNFKDFYDGGEPAIFQIGTLYLDQRSCMLCLPVEDVGRHVAMAGMAGTYLAYIDCFRKATGEKKSVLAAFTNGESDNLMVGRNGLFYDRQGRDWDATITKIVENPISIRQAFWSPYKKLVRLIEEQVAKRAAAADAAANEKLNAAATTVAHIDKAKPIEPKKVDVGTVAALGVAFGAIGTMITALVGYALGILDRPFWMICIGFVGLLFLISGPSMLIAYLKLRKRNLGPILDANGWAVNTRAKINVPFGANLTQVAELPQGARIGIHDRFAEAPPTWPKFVLAIVIICFVYSVLNDCELIWQMSGKRFGKHTVATVTTTASTTSTNAASTTVTAPVPPK